MRFFSETQSLLGLVFLLCVSATRGIQLRSLQSQISSASALPIPNANEGKGVNGNEALASAYSNPPISSQMSGVASQPALQQPVGSMAIQHVASQQPPAQSMGAYQQQPAQNIAPYQQQPAQNIASYQQPPAQNIASRQQQSNPPAYRVNFKQPPKPNIDSVKGSLLKFTPYVAQTEEDCEKVSTDLKDANLFQQHIHIHNVLSHLSHKQLEEHEKIRINADLSKEFISLEHIMLDRDDTTGGADLHQFFKRLAKCKIEQDTGRGILQQMMYLGLGQALKTPFGRLLLVGEAGHEPSYEADTEGNTLLHLAVMSGAVSLPKDLIMEEIKKHRGDKSRQSNGMFWALSCFEHKNRNGQNPVELAADEDVLTYLKNTYRTYYNYVEKNLRTTRGMQQG